MFCRGNFTPFMSKSFQIWGHFLLLLCPKDSENLKSLNIWLREVRSKSPVNEVRNTDAKKILLSKAKFAHKITLFLRSDFTPFICKSFKIWDHFYLLLFPKDSESLKNLDIRLGEVGAKRCLNGTSKVNTHTNTQTDISTYRKHRPRGSMLWKLSLGTLQGHRPRELSGDIWNPKNP